MSVSISVRPSVRMDGRPSIHPSSHHKKSFRFQTGADWARLAFLDKSI